MVKRWKRSCPLYRVKLRVLVHFVRVLILCIVQQCGNKMSFKQSLRQTNCNVLLYRFFEACFGNLPKKEVHNHKQCLSQWQLQGLPPPQPHPSYLLTHRGRRHYSRCHLLSVVNYNTGCNQQMPALLPSTKQPSHSGTFRGGCVVGGRLWAKIIAFQMSS